MWAGFTFFRATGSVRTTQGGSAFPDHLSRHASKPKMVIKLLRPARSTPSSNTCMKTPVKDTDNTEFKYSSRKLDKVFARLQEKYGKPGARIEKNWPADLLFKKEKKNTLPGPSNSNDDDPDAETVNWRTQGSGLFAKTEDEDEHGSYDEHQFSEPSRTASSVLAERENIRRLREHQKHRELRKARQAIAQAPTPVKASDKMRRKRRWSHISEGIPKQAENGDQPQQTSDLTHRDTADPLKNCSSIRYRPNFKAYKDKKYAQPRTIYNNSKPIRTNLPKTKRRKALDASAQLELKNASMIVHTGRTIDRSSESESDSELDFEFYEGRFRAFERREKYRNEQREEVELGSEWDGVFTDSDENDDHKDGRNKKRQGLTGGASFETRDNGEL